MQLFFYLCTVSYCLWIYAKNVNSNYWEMFNIFYHKFCLITDIFLIWFLLCCSVNTSHLQQCYWWFSWFKHCEYNTVKERSVYPYTIFSSKDFNLLNVEFLLYFLPRISFKWLVSKYLEVGTEYKDFFKNHSF